ncbi:hypothetical protein BZA05DRAFT_383478 [Tricharina praecox]|uniref:uncharacterized protein n=1 Tax=Tricharina praecox TaxID=43433 RepID=UPI002220ED00|nr:uncharacterized protein BZA05DRAFT_383478 [Tricharina praecox]KAI5859141.1 hypothetical protein BZA05DRAFT_383478 [Tricharina praecox]
MITTVLAAVYLPSSSHAMLTFQCATCFRFRGFVLTTISTYRVDHDQPPGQPGSSAAETEITRRSSTRAADRW